MIPQQRCLQICILMNFIWTWIYSFFWFFFQEPFCALFFVIFHKKKSSHYFLQNKNISIDLWQINSVEHYFERPLIRYVHYACNASINKSTFIKLIHFEKQRPRGNICVTYFMQSRRQIVNTISDKKCHNFHFKTAILSYICSI